MNMERRRQLLEEYKHRKPEMGVLAIRSMETGEVYLGISRDIKADINSNRFKLNANGHPNQRLQALWNQYGEEKFELSAAAPLEYEDPTVDHTQALEELLARCMREGPCAGKIWR